MIPFSWALAHKEMGLLEGAEEIDGRVYHTPMQFRGVARKCHRHSAACQGHVDSSRRHAWASA